MEKILLVLMTGFATMTAPVYAQFNTVARIPSLYKVETTTPDSDDDISKTDSLTEELFATLTEQSSSPSEFDDNYKKAWTDRFLSVCYPLRHITINSPFGYRRDPFTGKKKFHRGLDLHARNDEVFAMLDGMVINVGQDTTSGKYVTLRHGNYTVSYCHLSQTVVERGATVKAGTVVGITGSTGRSTGEHLHITCKLNGKDIDPILILDFIKTTREQCVDALIKAI